MTKISMTIFETELEAEALKKMLLNNPELQNYRITEDICNDKIFKIQHVKYPQDIHTLGIKNNTIWTSELTLYIEEMLLKERVPYKKNKYPFESPEEVRTLFEQKYLM